jgi:signal transduction histidine kinase
LVADSSIPLAERVLAALRRVRTLDELPDDATYELRVFELLREEVGCSGITRLGSGTEVAATARSVIVAGGRNGDARLLFASDAAFATEQAIFAEILGGEALLLLERAAAARAADRQGRKLALVDKVRSGAGDIVSAAELARRTAGELCEAFGASHIGLHVPVDGHLELVARLYADDSSRLDDAPPWLRRMPLDSNSFPARAFSERRILVPRVDELFEPAREVLGPEGVVQLVFAPLFVGDVDLGVLSITRREVRWDEEQNRMLEDVTRRLAVDLLQSRLLENERRRARELIEINEVGALLAEQLDLDAILETAVRELARAIDVPRVAIGLVDEERRFITTTACNQEVYATVRVPVDGQSSVSLAFRTGRPVVVDDAPNDPRTYRELVRAVGALSLFVVPLIARGEPIGTVLLAETRHRRQFRDDEVARATAIANLVSPAIVNARIHADLRHSYEALRQAQADVVSNERLAALGELSAVIAHEVRNPLAVIFNSLGTLRKLPAPSGDAKILLDIVGEEADRLNRIVGDLLDFVRPYTCHPRAAILEDLVHSAVAGARRSISTATVTIETHLVPPSPEVILDPTMVQQALINLIVNAVQATPSGGTVGVRTSFVEAASAEDGRREIRFEVADEGVGIDPADASRIFQPFFTTKPTGTGLGLAVVRRIADALGGRVDVRRRSPCGSVFTFTVPAEERTPVSQVG